MLIYLFAVLINENRKVSRKGGLSYGLFTKLPGRHARKVRLFHHRTETLIISAFVKKKLSAQITIIFISPILNYWGCNIIILPGLIVDKKNLSVFVNFYNISSATLERYLISLLFYAADNCLSG